MDLDAIPPAPREPSPKARALVFGYQAGQKVLLLVGSIFTVVGLALAIGICWGLPIDVAILFTGTTQRGHILSAAPNRNVTVNGRHPYKVQFSYAVDGTRLTSESTTLDGATAHQDGTVEVEVSSLNPAWARIKGTTRTVTGSWGTMVLFFPILGLLLAISAVRGRRRTERSFRNGTPAAGKIVSAGLNRRVRINGRNPFQVTWEFTVEDRVYRGSLSAMDAAVLEELARSKDLAVLYDPQDPKQNAPWIE